MTRDIALPDPCIFDSSIGLDEPSNVNVESYVDPVVVYLANAPAVVSAYVLGSGTLGSSQSYAIPKLIVAVPSGLVNNDICWYIFLLSVESKYKKGVAYTDVTSPPLNVLPVSCLNISPFASPCRTVSTLFINPLVDTKARIPNN